ncbi:outer membrane lipoprotein LolB [Viridibacterium curvum]|uniref:Outer-membrane lipoprotein LolB n=1 Tax=Viridibacterium curvum TaxID=1101404 RepID=A0ABP9QZA1_9RHOO
MNVLSAARTLLLGLCAILLAACAGQPSRPTDVPPRPPRSEIQNFALTARVAITQARRAETIRMAWEHTPAQDAMGFENSLGMIVAELQRDAQGARWLTSAGEKYESRSADELMARLTDRPVPIQSLSLWVVGRLGQNGIAKFDDKGRLLEGLDSGWTIRVQEYEADRPDALPRIVEAEVPGLRIRLVIDSWLL